ncbi:MAG: helicase-exonuclease AddAB subunit AddB [Firmicutes bacterium]|nr:helicase-exonuclease AddAB subunit AddB [Bacillota bacterium]
MTMRYIIGRAKSGKNEKVLSEIKENIKKNTNKKLILLVPEQFTLQAEYDLISKMDLDGIMGLEVLSFKRLAYKVFNEVGGLKKIDINDLGKVMVLRNLFDEYFNELNVYKKVSKQDGFLKDFSDLVTEFKRNDITYDILKKDIKDVEDEMLKRKLKDISLMYKEFSGYMEDKYSDDEDKFNLLIEKMDESNFLDGAEIWIDGFSKFTSQKYRIIEKLLLKASRVNITLTLDLDWNVNDYDLFSPSMEVFRRLKKITYENGIEEEIVNIRNNNLTKELKHIEKELYSYPYNVYEKEVKNLELFSALNQYTEIENTACKIISLVRDKGYTWKDIAVVTNSLETYSMTIKRVFSEYNIPFFLDEKRNILNNPLIKFILSGINIIERNFRYDDVFRFIKTGFTDLTKYEYEILENYALEYGIKGNMWFEEFKYGDDLKRLNEIRIKFSKNFRKYKSEMIKENTVKEYTNILFNFLKDMNLEDKLNAWIEKLKYKKRLEHVNENTQIWNIVMEIFDQLVKILGDKKVSLKEYSEILEAGFSEYQIGIIPPTMDQVLVGNLERSRSHDIKALFVVGVNDGILPSVKEDDGLLLDEEKLLLKGNGIDIQNDSYTKSNEERMSIYSSLTKPEEYLWLSYALSDMEGKALRPSILISRMKKLFSELKLKSDVERLKGKEYVNRQLELITSPLPTFKYLIENLREYVDDNNIDDIWWDVFKWYYNHDSYSGKINMMIKGLFHNNQENYLDERKVKEVFQTPIRSSISRIEEFANCPFSHFVSYGLNPKERKEYKIEMPDIGMLFHYTAENYAKALKEQGLDWRDIDKSRSDEIIDKIISELVPDFQNNILKSSHRYRYLIEKLKRIGKRAAWTLTNHVKRGSFEPSYYEIEFTEEKKEEALPPIEVDLENGEKIILKGRIDRVDVLKKEDGNYIKVIDYKSGNKSFSLTEAYYGLQIQLLAYLDAVLKDKKLIENPKYPAGVFYFKIDDPLVKDKDVSDDPEKEIFKKLKLDGVALKDKEIVKSLDNEIERERKSPVIPVQVKKNGDLSKRSSALDEKEMKDMISHVRSVISDVGKELVKGNIRIDPCKLGTNDSCRYCDYKSICQFDTSFEDNSYRVLNKLKDKEVIERIKNKEVRSDG